MQLGIRTRLSSRLHSELDGVEVEEREEQESEHKFKAAPFSDCSRN